MSFWQCPGACLMVLFMSPLCRSRAVNQRPENEDDQPVPKSLVRLMRSVEEMKSRGTKGKKGASTVIVGTKGKKGATTVAVGTIGKRCDYCRGTIQLHSGWVEVDSWPSD